MPERAEALEHVAEAVRGLAEQAERQRVDLAAYDKRRRRDLAVVGMVLVLLAGVLVAVGVGAWRLWDCTSPSGHCYRDGQKRTGDAILRLNQHGDQDRRAVALCSKEAVDVGELRLCLKKLEKR